MRTFVIVMFTLHVLSAGIKLNHLNGEHPRKEETTFSTDVTAFIFMVGMIIWGGTLLFNP